MKNSLYYSVKKVLKTWDFTLGGKKALYVLNDIDLISRAILELGINDEDKVLVVKQNSLEYVCLIYAFSKLGLSVTIASSDYDASDFSYVFTDNITDLNLDSYKRVILFGNEDVLDDAVISWKQFFAISKYYNKELIYYDDFKINYCDNGILLSLSDKDIISSYNKIGERLDISGDNVSISFASFVLINYLIMNKNNIFFGFSNCNVLFTSDKDIFSRLDDLNYDTIYSCFEFISDYELSKIRSSLGEHYNRYFAFFTGLFGIGSNGNFILSSNSSISIVDVISGKKSSFGSICVKVGRGYIKTGYVGMISDDELVIYDYLKNEIVREKYRKTGLASKDKPWEKYYSFDSLADRVSENTLYQNLKIKNENNYLETALEYMGREIKYYEVFNEIEKVSRGLYALGVRKGDYVAFLLPNIPEFVYFFYAASKIGAVACLIEPRTSAKRILEYLDDSKSKVMVMLDLCRDNINKIIDNSSLERVISISPIESIKNRKVRSMYFLTHKRHRCSGKYISYNKFISVGESVPIFKENVYGMNEAAAIVYTSGTTGKPKGAILTNETYNGQNMQLKYSGIEINVGDRFLGNIPFFTAYGSSVGMHNALSSGVKITLIPSYKPKDFPRLVKKYRPNHVIGTPRFFEIMSESNIFKNENLDYLKTSIYGGDKMSSVKECEVNEFLISHGSCVIRKGLGMSEYGGGFCTTVNSDVNKIGSIGIPHVGNNVKIVDAYGNEVSYGRGHNVGELYVTGPTRMLGYLANPLENEKFFVTDENGVRWSKTGDLAYMDEDGVIFFAERIKNIIIRPDGHKVSVLPLENLVYECKYVSECVVVGVNCKDDVTGKYPMIYISLKDDLNVSKEKVHKEIMDMILTNIPDRDRPRWYRYVDRLPYTLAGKVDVVKLREKGKNNQNKAVLFDIKKK